MINYNKGQQLSLVVFVLLAAIFAIFAMSYSGIVNKGLKETNDGLDFKQIAQTKGVPIVSGAAEVDPLSFLDQNFIKNSYIFINYFFNSEEELISSSDIFDARDFSTGYTLKFFDSFEGIFVNISLLSTSTYSLVSPSSRQFSFLQNIHLAVPLQEGDDKKGDSWLRYHYLGNDSFKEYKDVDILSVIVPVSEMYFNFKSVDSFISVRTLNPDLNLENEKYTFNNPQFFVYRGTKTENELWDIFRSPITFIKLNETDSAKLKEKYSLNNDVIYVVFPDYDVHRIFYRDLEGDSVILPPDDTVGLFQELFYEPKQTESAPYDDTDETSSDEEEEEGVFSMIGDLLR